MNPLKPPEPKVPTPPDSSTSAGGKPTVAELHPSEQMAGALLESAVQAIVATDRAGEIVLANRQAEEMFGYTRDELLGSSIEMLVPDPKRGAHARMRGEYLKRPSLRPMGSGMDLFALRKDGSEFPVDVGLSHMETAAGVFAIAFISDTSQRKQLEQQLLHAQKMEAIGRLAGGIAHDFNNMLTTISGYGGMVLDELSAGDPLRSHVEEILRASNRAAGLTAQLLAFGRRQVTRPKVIGLNALIANTEKMLRRLIGEDIVLELILEGGLGNVEADPGHVEQAIVNLVVNSRDAMPAGGRILMETANVSLDANYAKTRAGLEPGEFVMVAISDTGDGMDAVVQQRIFEPFFTTKERGKGTGLGLATVYGTMKQAGGDIWLHSEPGKGTTFKLYFPRVDTPVASSTAAAAQPEPRGDETVLVVEDDPQVRDITVRMLNQLGYETLPAATGAEALEIAKAHSGTIHLLLTDLVMPNMNGHRLADELARSRPEMKVLFVSGYTGNVATHHGIADSSVAFLPKPFSREELAKAVCDVLENRRTAK
jgi:PAS domain S-box-containing protein